MLGSISELKQVKDTINLGQMTRISDKSKVMLENAMNSLKENVNNMSFNLDESAIIPNDQRFQGRRINPPKEDQDAVQMTVGKLSNEHSQEYPMSKMDMGKNDLKSL